LRKAPDPRGKNTRFRIGPVLSIVSMALLCGARQISEIARFANRLHPRQRAELGLPIKKGARRFYEVPTYSVFYEVLTRMDAHAFAVLLSDWLGEQQGALPGALALDGKMIRNIIGTVSLVDVEDGSPVAVAVAYAGLDAVRFALAATPPGGAPPKAEVIARHVLSNPAYAVRYAHAAAAAVLRWAASLDSGPGGFRPRLLTAPLELALLDALSWLPERVAMAARRGRPDEFAGYLAELAARTIDTMSTTGFTTISSISSERLWLADAARTGLAAGLELLGVDAPERI